MTRKLLTAVLCLACTGAVLAQPGKKQDTEKLTPPVPNQVDKPTVIVFYLLVILIAGVGIGAMLIPTRRGHQD